MTADLLAKYLYRLGREVAMTTKTSRKGARLRLCEGGRAGSREFRSGELSVICREHDRALLSAGFAKADTQLARLRRPLAGILGKLLANEKLLTVQLAKRSRALYGGKSVASKKDELLQLAISRKHSRWDGYDCIGDFHGGVYECNYVSPYTIGAHNVDSPLMILLQDWAYSQCVEQSDFT